jgi:SAM-dependent methyltransferase
MMNQTTPPSADDFDRQVAAGLSQSLRGWDFSWLNARTSEEPLPWDYRALALERLPGCGALLDIGTGGGEFLAGLFQPDGPAVPPTAWATEGYPPNVPLARARLAPLGIQVADTSQSEEGALPFPDGSFDLVIDRHMGLPGTELYRVLRPGGRHLTQQVGGLNCIDLNRALGGPDPQYAFYTLDYARADLQGAGLRLLQAREHFPRWTFHDLAGVIFYLKVIPWQVPGFTVEGYRDPLRAIHQTILETGGFAVREHRILLEAERPA